jgi:hypothetical protein
MLMPAEAAAMPTAAPAMVLASRKTGYRRASCEFAD